MAKQNGKSPTSATKSQVRVQKAKPSNRQARRTKKQVAVALLRRPKGASIAEVQNALGWQSHSVRGFLAGTVRKMPAVTLGSDKAQNGTRRYRIQAASK